MLSSGFPGPALQNPCPRGHLATQRPHTCAQSCPTIMTPWTVTRQAPLSMGFSRQEYWSGLLFPSPGDLPNPGIEPGFPALQVDSLPSEPTEKPSLPLGLCHLPSGKKSLPCPAYRFTPALLLNFMSPSNMLVILLFFFLNCMSPSLRSKFTRAEVFI